MDWTDEPATERQLTMLRVLGFVQARPLTVTEAARLIRQYQKNPPRAVPVVREQLERRGAETRAVAALQAMPVPASTQLPNGAPSSGTSRPAPGDRSSGSGPPPGPSPAHSADLSESTRMQAYRLRAAVENAKKAMALNPNAPNVRADLAAAKAGRQEFWLDTCREVKEMHNTSVQVLELYQAYGCRFSAPIAAQVQDILDALDPALPLWDRDHPELFYQTLELNFPQLLRLR